MLFIADGESRYAATQFMLRMCEENMVGGDFVLFIADMDIILSLRPHNYERNGYHWGKNLQFFMNYFNDRSRYQIVWYGMVLADQGSTIIILTSYLGLTLGIPIPQLFNFQIFNHTWHVYGKTTITKLILSLKNMDEILRDMVVHHTWQKVLYLVFSLNDIDECTVISS